MFNQIHSSTNQELFEKYLCNRNSHNVKYGCFLFRREAITCSRQIDTFPVSKDEWDTKEDTGKSMKNALYVLWYAKRHCRAEATSNSEKIKPVALAVIELHLSEGLKLQPSFKSKTKKKMLFNIVMVISKAKV